MANSVMVLMALLVCLPLRARAADRTVVDATSLRGKVMCGYQGWFRCPGDSLDLGWVHWSRRRDRIAPETLTFEMWPDMSEYSESERFVAPGFTYPDGSQAHLFSSDNAKTVLRHFRWMRDYGIDGAWVQRFLAGLPGGRFERGYGSRQRVVEHVRGAAGETGRVWAISYDIAGMPIEDIFDVMTSDWKRIVDGGIVDDERYLHEGGKPVVEVWGFYHNNPHDPMTSELADRIIGFFKSPGRYSAYLVGGGAWNWRTIADGEWKRIVSKFDAYCPWNIGNYEIDGEGHAHAATHYWADDMAECQRNGVLWIPTVYPGFGWDNLKRLEPGTSTIPRRRGRFLWEQFHALRQLGVDTVYVAMFDEVDEGTAIFKVTSSPPPQCHFLGYEGLPSDWYLRLVGEGIRMLRGDRPMSAEIPISP